MVDCIRAVDRAAALLDPLRLRILALARTPASAAEIAAKLNLPRQRVNYHVGELARKRLLKRAGNRMRGNLVERRFVAASDAYTLSPELLGELQPDPTRFEDRRSAAYLIALAAQAQAAVGRSMAEATAAGKRLATLSLASEFHFESAQQRQEFAEALEVALTAVMAHHTTPAQGPGRPYRLMLACYPVAMKGTSDEA